MITAREAAFNDRIAALKARMAEFVEKYPEDFTADELDAVREVCNRPAQLDLFEVA